SGRQANTLTFANDGAHARSIAMVAPRDIHLFVLFIFVFLSVWALELVRAVRAKAHDVLEENLVVRFIEPGLVAGELQPEAGKLGRRKINHDRAALGIVLRQPREVRSAQSAAADEPDIRITAVEFFVTQPGAPTWH